MNWDVVESTIKSHIETQWALSAYASSWPLVWENENQQAPKKDFIFLSIQGTYSDKAIYGSVGKRLSVEAGIVFYHGFGQIGRGKQQILQSIVAMSDILELQTLSSVIDFSGADTPSPAQPGRLDRDIDVTQLQPEGNYFRISASVPFIVRGSK